MAEVAVVERPKRSRKAGAGGDKKKSGGGDGGDQSEHDLHIWTERERRKKMRTMFSDLHALLPHLPPKADKSTIVDEAVKYIKTLQHTFQTLQKQKLQKLSSGSAASTSAVDLAADPSPAPESRESFLADSMVMRSQPPSKNYSMAANMAAHTFLSPAATFQTWLSPNVVINMCGNDAQIAVCTPPKRGLLATMFYILEKHNLELLSAHVSSDQYRSLYMIHVQAGERCDQFLDTLTVEEVFKLAAGEMNLWLLTC